jgi:DNA-binding SARP family transcriptional activator
VLGPLVFERDGRVVAIPSGRQRSLLALLLAEAAPLSRDRLIDELWGERPPASAVSALHVHLSKLRLLLGGLLVLDPAGYSLRGEQFELDARRFDALVEQARAEPRRGRELLAEALALFRGEPLCDVACEGTVGQWRNALQEKRLQATLLRIDADLAAAAAGELVGELERLASEYPFEERLWGQLMLALYRSGRQADALDAFARARRAFAAELGIEPGEQLAVSPSWTRDCGPRMSSETRRWRPSGSGASTRCSRALPDSTPRWPWTRQAPGSARGTRPRRCRASSWIRPLTRLRTDYRLKARV